MVGGNKSRLKNKVVGAPRRVLLVVGGALPRDRPVVGGAPRKDRLVGDGGPQRDRLAVVAVDGVKLSPRVGVSNPQRARGPADGDKMTDGRREMVVILAEVGDKVADLEQEGTPLEKVVAGGKQEEVGQAGVSKAVVAVVVEAVEIRAVGVKTMMEDRHQEVILQAEIRADGVNKAVVVVEIKVVGVKITMEDRQEAIRGEIRAVGVKIIMAAHHQDRTAETRGVGVKMADNLEATLPAEIIRAGGTRTIINNHLPVVILLAAAAAAVVVSNKGGVNQIVIAEVVEIKAAGTKEEEEAQVGAIPPGEIIKVGASREGTVIAALVAGGILVAVQVLVKKEVGGRGDDKLMHLHRA